GPPPRPGSELRGREGRRAAPARRIRVGRRVSLGTPHDAGQRHRQPGEPGRRARPRRPLPPDGRRLGQLRLERRRGVRRPKGSALIGIVEGYSTARVTPQGGGNSTWYIDVPVPGQTFVTPMSDVRRFLSESGYASLVDGSAAPLEISGASASPPR